CPLAGARTQATQGDGLRPDAPFAAGMARARQPGAHRLSWFGGAGRSLTLRARDALGGLYSVVFAADSSCSPRLLPAPLHLLAHFPHDVAATDAGGADSSMPLLGVQARRARHIGQHMHALRGSPRESSGVTVKRRCASAHLATRSAIAR